MFYPRTIAVISDVVNPNLFINGNFNIVQGGAGTIVAGTGLPTASLGYAPMQNNWFNYSVGGNPTIAQVVGSGSTLNRLQITGAPGITAIGVGQRIQSSNAAQLAGNSATLSVSLANSLGSPVTWSAFTPNLAVAAPKGFVAETLSVGSGPESGTYVPALDRLYVTNNATNTVSVIDPNTGRVVATIVVGSNPTAILYVASVDRLYVTNTATNTISVIDPNLNAVIATIAGGGGPRSLIYLAGVDRLYVANQSTNNVSVINPNLNTVAATIAVGTGPISLIYLAGVDRIYVVNQNTSNVSVINPNLNTVAATITVGAGPRSLIYLAGVDRLYVANQSTNTVSAINPNLNTVATTITVGAGPTSLIYLAGVDRLYVTNYSPNTVSAINPNLNTVIATIAVGTGPLSLIYLAGVDRIYVVNQMSANVSAINPNLNTVVATITVGNSPRAATYISGVDRAYIPNQGSNSLSAINPLTSTDVFGTIGTPTKALLATGTFAATSTLTAFSASFACDANVRKGLEIILTVGSQTSGTWVISKAKLELGSTATAFVNPDFTSELIRCQRHYWLGRNIHLTGGQTNHYFKAEMYDDPIVAWSGAGTFSATPITPGSITAASTTTGIGTITASAQIP